MKSRLKKHTGEIRLNEKHLSLIYDTLSDVVLLLAVEPDDCFRFVSVNRAFLAVTGLSREQVVGKRIEQVLPETAHALVISKSKEAIVDNKTVFREEVSTYPTGELVGAVKVTPFWTAERVCTHLVGSVHDLTEVRRAEEALRNSHEDWKTTFDAMTDWVSLIDPNTYTIINSNKAGEEVTGRPINEIIWNKCYEMIHNSDEPHPDCPIQKILKSKNRD
jgi:PAS domain S-box-containing protein